MPSFLQPDPVLLAFTAVKEWIYILALFAFGFVRVPTLRGAAFWAALAGWGISAVLVFAYGIVTFMGVSTGPAFQIAGFLGGMAALLLPSALFASAALLPGRRFWGLDAVHLIGLLGLLGLWLYSRMT